MRHYIFYILFASLFLFSSCEEPPFVFTVPQPEDYYETPYFHEVFQGIYFCTSDSSLVYINEKSVHKEKPFAFHLTLQELETSNYGELRGNIMYIYNSGEHIPVKIVDDVIYGEMTIADTLFSVSERQILKYYNGHQVLNTLLPGEKWKVQILSLNNDGDLELLNANKTDDLSELSEITRVHDISTKDRTQFLLKPSRLEFEEILTKQLIFESCDLYERLFFNLEN